MTPGQTKYTLPPYNGQTIDKIASTDKGLLFLDSVLDKLPMGSPLRKAVQDYLADPVIKQDLDRLLDEEE